MHEQSQRTVPWIERIAHWVPGYGGYLERGNRRAADQALREAIAAKLEVAHKDLEASMRKFVDMGALDKLAPVERVGGHLDRVANRIRSAGAGTSDFYGSETLDPQKADALHAFDFQLLDRVETLVKNINVPTQDGDWLAHIEAALAELDDKLDERASALQGIR